MLPKLQTAISSCDVFNVISVLTFVAAVFFLFHRGFNLSIEFTGGTVLEVTYSQPADVERVKATLEEIGFHDTSVSIFGRAQDVLIRLPSPKTGQTAAQAPHSTHSSLIK